MSSKGPRPLFLTKSDISLFYKVDNRKVEAIVRKLRPVGVHTGNKLYSRPDVEKEIKKQ